MNIKKPKKQDEFIAYFLEDCNCEYCLYYDDSGDCKFAECAIQDDIIMAYESKEIQEICPL